MSTTGQRGGQPAGQPGGQPGKARTNFASRREKIALALLCTALAGMVALNVRLRPVPNPLVVAAPRQLRVTSGLGPEMELIRRFAAEQGVEVQMLYTDTPDEAIEKLERGKADVALALGVAPLDDPPPGQKLIPTDKRAARRVVYGPQYDEQPMYAVDWENSFNATAPGPLHPALDELMRVSRSFSQEPREAPALPLDALLLLIPFTPEVRDSAPTGQQASYRFAWRRDIRKLDEAMRAFWKRISADGTLDGILADTLDHLPDDPDPVEMDLLRKTLVKNAPPLAEAIRKAAARNKVDPFLLMAIIHQESHFNPAAVSVTGVRGLMQMTTTTLEHLGVKNADDQAEVVAAGARYLADLRQGYADMGYGPVDAQMLGLAAFNVGQGHVSDAIELVSEEGGPRPSWRDVRQALPLLTRPDIAAATKYGLCRGYEAVDFVDKVRYFAFAIKGLVLGVRAGGAQDEQLAGLGLALTRP